MAQLKTVFIACGAAFVLSFFTAIFSRVGFPLALARAIGSAVFFGGLTFGIKILFEKVLNADVSGQESGDEQQPKQMTGTKVDLTLQEEELAEDENAPQFSVEQQTHFLNQEDLRRKASGSGAENRAVISDEIERIKNKHAGNSSEAPAAGQDGFKPMNLGAAPRFKSVEPEPENAPEEKLDELPQTEKAPEPAAVSADKPLPQADSGKSEAPLVSDEETLDELPELDLGGASLTGAADDIIEDSEFASKGSARGSSETTFPDGKVADAKDSGVMAEAIRTILANES